MKTHHYVIYFSSLFLLPFYGKCQTDLSKFSGSYECVEVLEHTDIHPRPGLPGIGECWIVNKKYETTDKKNYAYQISEPFRVEIKGNSIKTNSTSELYTESRVGKVHFKTIVEQEGVINGNIATLNGKWRKEAIEPSLPINNNSQYDKSEFESTIDLSEEGFLIVTLIQKMYMSSSSSWSTIMNKSRYKRIN